MHQAKAISWLFWGLSSRQWGGRFVQKVSIDQQNLDSQPPDAPPPFLLLHPVVNPVLISYLICNIYSIHTMIVVINNFWTRKRIRMEQPAAVLDTFLFFSIHLRCCTHVNKKRTSLVLKTIKATTLGHTGPPSRTVPFTVPFASRAFILFESSSWTTHDGNPWFFLLVKLWIIILFLPANVSQQNFSER